MNKNSEPSRGLLYFEVFWSRVFFGGTAFAQIQSISQTESYSPDYNFTASVDTEINIGATISAYNSVNHEYLVVWEESSKPIEGSRVFATRVSAADGRVLTPKFMVSPATGDEAPIRDAHVAYDPNTNLFLVIWGPSHAVIAKVTGQFIRGGTGEKVGAPFYIGNGFNPDPTIMTVGVEAIKILYNSALKEYLVTWIGTASYAAFSKESEVFVARVSPDGVPGTNVRVSYFGPPKDGLYKVHSPDTAYNSKTNEYLVVWGTFTHGVGNEQDYYSQRLSAANIAATQPSNQLLAEFNNISLNPNWMVPGSPSLAYNPNKNEYFVLIEGLWVIGGYRLSGTTAEKISRHEINRGNSQVLDTEPESSPIIRFLPALNRYIVMFQGTRKTETNKKPYVYLYGQLLDGDTGERTGVRNFRITQFPTGDKHNMTVTRNTPTLAIDNSENIFAAYSGGYPFEDGTSYVNIYGKTFKPFLDERVFPEDDLPTPPPVKLVPWISVLSADKKSYQVQASCRTNPRLEVPMMYRFYFSADTTLDKKKDKLKKTKRTKPGTLSLKLKIKKEKKMAAYVLLECTVMSADPTMPQPQATSFKLVNPSSQPHSPR